MKTTDTCPRCGRPEDPDGCRDAQLGWYCIVGGLQMDTRRIVAPRVLPYNPDPVPAAEQAVLDEYAGPIGQAQAAVDQAQEEWTAAVQAVHQATLNAASAGVSCNVLNVTVLDPHNELKVRRKDSSAGKRYRLVEAHDQAVERSETAERALDRARNRLNALQHEQELAQRRARMPAAA